MRLVLLLVLAAAIVVGVARAAVPPASFLFSQDAGGGSLRGPNEQHLTLTLHPVRDWVTRFTDRPYRAAETVDIRDFLARWQERFAKRPPNAVLSYRVAGDPFPRDMVLELTRPRYDAARKTMTYDARRIRRTTDTFAGTKHHRKPVVYPIPRAFGAATLFIDSASACQWQSVKPYTYAAPVTGIVCSAPGVFVRNSSIPPTSTSNWDVLVHHGASYVDLTDEGDTASLGTAGYYYCTDIDLHLVDCSHLGELG